MNRSDYRVTGMTCGHCAAGVTEQVSSVPGVSDVSVDLENDTVRVTGPGFDDAQVRAAIEEAGYEAGAAAVV